MHAFERLRLRLPSASTQERPGPLVLPGLPSRASVLREERSISPGWWADGGLSTRRRVHEGVGALFGSVLLRNLHLVVGKLPQSVAWTGREAKAGLVEILGAARW